MSEERAIRMADNKWAKAGDRVCAYYYCGRGESGMGTVERIDEDDWASIRLDSTGERVTANGERLCSTTPTRFLAGK